MKIKKTLFLSFVFLTFCFPVRAQQQSSIQLSGRIFDLNGSVIPGIKVVAYSEGKSKYEQISNEEGIYTLSLPAGIYNVEINKQDVKYNGFEFVRFKPFRVVPAYDGKMSLDFSLGAIDDKPICELTVESPKIKVNKNKSIKRKIINNE